MFTDRHTREAQDTDEPQAETKVEPEEAEDKNEEESAKKKKRRKKKVRPENEEAV